MSSPGNPVRFSAAVVATWILVLVHLNTKGTDDAKIPGDAGLD